MDTELQRAVLTIRRAGTDQVAEVIVALFAELPSEHEPGRHPAVCQRVMVNRLVGQLLPKEALDLLWGGGVFYAESQLDDRTARAYLRSLLGAIRDQAPLTSGALLGLLAE